jgi:hypothetical protein
LSEFLGFFLLGVIGKLKDVAAEDRTRLGLMPMRLLEIFNYAIRGQKVREWLVGVENVFPVVLALVRKYPFNNIFHNEVFKLINAALAAQENALTIYVRMG